MFLTFFVRGWVSPESPLLPGSTKKGALLSSQTAWLETLWKCWDATLLETYHGSGWHGIWEPMAICASTGFFPLDYFGKFYISQTLHGTAIYMPYMPGCPKSGLIGI